MHSRESSLSELVDSYQAGGRYVLSRKDALSELRISEEALKKAVRRLVAKRRLAVPHRGFYVIVPIEYREAHAPPASWFIDELMRFLGQRYYVGLLSAAALHGAAHHQPQEFQVVTNVQRRSIAIGRSRIRFFRKVHLERTPFVNVRTETGTMRVSTPEATAFDLFRYIEGAGHLGHVATVLAELADKLDAAQLVEVAKIESELPSVQRLGHVLDHVGAGEVAAGLAAVVAERRPRYVPLRQRRRVPGAAKDPRFRVIANEEIEADT